MKKLLLVLLVCFVTLTSCITDEASEKKDSGTHKSYTIESEKDFNVYHEFDKVFDVTKITKFKELSNVGYVEVSDFMDLTKKLFLESVNDENVTFSCKWDENGVLITRENGSTCYINALDNTITFSNFQLFINSSYSKEGEYLNDYAYLTNKDSNDVLFLTWADYDYVIKTQDRVVFDLNNYDIDIIKYNNKIYIPFQLANDLFLTYNYTPLCLCDQCIYISYAIYDGTYKEYKEEIKDFTINYTKDLLAYNYNEFCFLLDIYYGLEEDVGLDYSSFDNLFTVNGYKEAALNSIEGFDELINYVAYVLIDDVHTGMYNPSLGSTFTDYGPYGLCHNLYYNNYYYYEYYYNQYIDHEELYYEIGNTAIITLTTFNCDLDLDIYEEGVPKTLDDCGDDPLRLMVYAYAQITRTDSPIENVVVDVSNNTGGDTRFLTYTLGFFMEYVNTCTKDLIDNEIMVCSYHSDCNLDHVIDDNDQLLLDKNIFVISSGETYSCANEFVCSMSASGATILGKRSGGGSCVVFGSSTATNAAFCYSSCFKTMIYKNGQYINNDNGCEVDVFLTPQQMYNREELVKIINNLIVK